MSVEFNPNSSFSPFAGQAQAGLDLTSIALSAASGSGPKQVAQARPVDPSQFAPNGPMSQNRTIPVSGQQAITSILGFEPGDQRYFQYGDYFPSWKPSTDFGTAGPSNSSGQMASFVNVDNMRVLGNVLGVSPAMAEELTAIQENGAKIFGSHPELAGKVSGPDVEIATEAMSLNRHPGFAVVTMINSSDVDATRGNYSGIRETTLKALESVATANGTTPGRMLDDFRSFVASGPRDASGGRLAGDALLVEFARTRLNAADPEAVAEQIKSSMASTFADEAERIIGQARAQPDLIRR